MAIVTFTSPIDSATRKVSYCRSFAEDEYSSSLDDTNFRRKYLMTSVDGEDILPIDAEYVARTYSTLVADEDPDYLSSDNLSLQQVHPKAWIVTAQWASQGDLSPEDSGTGKPNMRFRVSTEGGTVETQYSLETVGLYEAGDATNHIAADKPKYNQLINVTEDGPQGTEVEIPSMEFEIEYAFPKGTVTESLLTNLYGYTKTVNNATWRGFPAGTVLFRGVTYESETNNHTDRVTYKFAASPNVTQSLPNGFTIAKGGWHYVWFRYVPAKKDNTEVMVPKNCYVERMYNSANFAILGIPTTV